MENDNDIKQFKSQETKQATPTFTHIWVILLKTGPKRGHFPDEINIKLKQDFF